MAVIIRLKRIGAHKTPNYRLVAADSRCRRDGKFIEELGFYNPLTKPHQLVVDKDNFVKWLKNGAQMSDTVRTLVQPLGILKAFHEEKVAIAKAKKEAKA